MKYIFLNKNNTFEVKLLVIIGKLAVISRCSIGNYLINRIYINIKTWFFIFECKIIINKKINTVKGWVASLWSNKSAYIKLK